MASKDSFLHNLAKKISKNTILDTETDSLFVTNPGISFETLKGLAKNNGFYIGQTSKGEYISIPATYKYFENDLNLYDNFMNTYTMYSKNYDVLMSAYKTFDLMDENLAEIGLILDTYASEVLSQGFVDNPLKITVSNANAQEVLHKVFSRNKIMSKVFAITRDLAKYGNVGAVLSYPALEMNYLVTDELLLNKINVSEDLNITIINPKYYKINTDSYNNIINYQTTKVETYIDITDKSPFDNKIWQPWQFCAWRIIDSTTEPYGKSMLWNMRSVFDQLTTLEALLGISRASNLQRLVFYVPVPNGAGLMDANEMLTDFKANYLNSAFSDNGSVRNGRKLPGANSILVLPQTPDGQKVSIDHIEAKIDLSSVEDVEYYLNKLFNSSALSKGYLNGDETITTAQTLTTQDLKLKRKLTPLKTALVEGFISLCENVLTHAGYDVSKIDIKVELSQPIQIAADTLEKYGAIVDLFKAFRELNENISEVNQFQILIKLGLDPDLAQLICANTNKNAMKDDDLTLAQFLKKQKASIINEKVDVQMSSKKHLDTDLDRKKALKEFYEKLTSTQKISLNENCILLGETSIIEEMAKNDN